MGTVTVKLVKCPHCSGDSLYTPSNPYRPFCSERCKQIDLGAWASEAFRLRADQANQMANSPSVAAFSDFDGES